MCNTRTNAGRQNGALKKQSQPLSDINEDIAQNRA